MIGCVAVTIALLAYTYAGYPLLIGLLARVRPMRRPPAPDSAGDGNGHDQGDAGWPSVSVCLPVFNGASYLPAKIRSLLDQDYPPERLEILIYCDGCTDDSESIARGIAASPEARGRVRVVASPDRRGKPTALNTLAPIATGDLRKFHIKSPSHAATRRDRNVGGEGTAMGWVVTVCESVFKFSGLQMFRTSSIQDCGEASCVTAFMAASRACA